MQTQTARIENWLIVESFASPYQPPENWSKVLKGNAFGHPRIEEGKFTSSGTLIKIENGKAYTKNTIWTLGIPDPDYLEWCKNNNFDIDCLNNKGSLEG